MSRGYFMHVVWEQRGRRYVASFLPVDPSSSHAVLSPSAVRVLKALDVPRTLGELAKILGMTPQAVHYHLKRLVELGIVRVEGTAEKKAYVRSADAYGVVLGRHEALQSHVPRPIERFFSPLARGGVFRSVIVVGAPDPHGFYLQRARDGHYSGVLGLFLGRYFAFSGFPVRVDTDILAGWDERDLLLVGGPVSNVISFELAEKTGRFFDLQRPWMIIGRRTVYTEQNVGIISKQRYRGHWYIMLAGVSALGTKAAVIALTQRWEELLTKYPGGEYYWIVQGMDKNGDGQIDLIKVLEQGAPQRASGRDTQR